MFVGEVGVRCPECEVIISVSVDLFMVADQEDERGCWATRVDDADLWAHVWAHDPEYASG